MFVYVAPDFLLRAVHFGNCNKIFATVSHQFQTAPSKGHDWQRVKNMLIWLGKSALSTSVYLWHTSQWSWYFSHKEVLSFKLAVTKCARSNCKMYRGYFKICISCPLINTLWWIFKDYHLIPHLQLHRSGVKPIESPSTASQYLLIQNLALSVTVWS